MQTELSTLPSKPGHVKKQSMNSLKLKQYIKIKENEFNMPDVCD